MDGDGSTITHDGILPDNLRNLIINNPHIKWIMATGRSLDLLRRLPIIDFLSRDVPHIVDGGGRLVMHSGSSVVDYYLTEEEIDCFFNQLDTQKVDFLYYFLDEKRSYIFSDNISRWHNLPQFIAANATNSITKYRQWAMQNRPTKLFIRINSPINFVGLNWHQNEQNIDLTTKGITKGSTCVELLKTLNLLPRETAFVFNDKNDLPLVTHPLLQDIIKIKVGSYMPEIKADYEVVSPYEVANILIDLIS